MRNLSKDAFQDNSPRVMTRKQVLEVLRRSNSLDHLDLRGVDLSGVVFDGASLRFTKLADSNLTRCSFKGSDLTGASLWHANLKDVVFDEAVMENADLDCANIDGCTFRNARIRKAIFPLPRGGMEQVFESVRSGARVHMERKNMDEEI